MLVPDILKYYIVSFIEIYYIQILFMKFTCKKINPIESVLNFLFCLYPGHPLTPPAPGGAGAAGVAGGRGGCGSKNWEIGRAHV